MKKLILYVILSGLYFIGFSQEAEVNTDQFLKEITDKSCECIDSVEIIDKTIPEVNTKINTCIEEAVVTYQFFLKLTKAEALTNASEDPEEEVKVEVNANTDSAQYKTYYYEIERYLMDHCSALKNKLSDHQILNEKSISKNEIAYDFYLKGIEEMESKNFEKAVKLFQQAVEEDREFAFAWDNLGLSYRNLNQFDNAIAAYEQSLKIDPNGMVPMQTIAIAYQYKNDYKKAIETFENMVEIDQFNPEIYYGIGVIYAVELDNYEEGLEYMCKAYNLYIDQHSPYRTDAESVINYIYQEMKEQDDVDKFDAILEANNISQNHE